jgi:uroporphyrinogen III methyltransferase/synthase
VEPPVSWDEVDRAIATLSRYRWLLVTSANAVRALFGRLQAGGRDARALGGVKVCAIGETTAEALRTHGVTPDRVAEDSTGEGVVAALAGEDLAGAAILFPRARVAREVVAEALTARGAKVDVVAVYENRPVGSVPPEVTDALRRRTGVIVTFTSASTVAGFLDALGADALELMRGAIVACLGPTTADAARRRGLTVAVQAARQTMAALVDALSAHARGERRS